VTKNGLVPARSTAAYPTLVEASTTHLSFLAKLAGLGAAAVLAVGIGACGDDGGTGGTPDSATLFFPPDAKTDARPWTDSTSMGIPDAHQLPDAQPTDAVAPDTATPDPGLPDGDTPDAP
jgi:hypothetical protein